MRTIFLAAVGLALAAPAAAQVSDFAAPGEAAPRLAPPLAPPVPVEVGPTPTFRYEAPAESHRLRAVAEIGSFLAITLTGYAFKPSPTAVSGSKLDGVRLDANPFRTNFGAHPVAGAIYYQLARSNRLSAAESALWSVAGSAVWETIEFRESASLNDLVVTPVGGVAIGAPLFELAAHFDRAPRSTIGEVLAWVSGLPKKATDAWDGARPRRGDPGDALESAFTAGGGAVRQGGAWRGLASLGLGWRLVRDAEWGAPGTGTHALLDAGVTGAAVEAAFSDRGVQDLSIRLSVLLAAVHARDLAEDGPARVRGVEALAGAGAGFMFRMHDWGAGLPGDWLAVVELPALAAEGAWSAGFVRARASLAAAPTLGGVRSLALAVDPGAVPPEELPTVQNAYDYHFGVGAALAPAVEVRIGPVVLEASGRGDWLRALNQPDPNPDRHPTAHLDERWLSGRLAARAALGRGLSATAAVARQVRHSVAGAAEWSGADTTVDVGLAWAP